VPPVDMGNLRKKIVRRCGLNATRRRAAMRSVLD
jgi:hypothetical protein